MWLGASGVSNSDWGSANKGSSPGVYHIVEKDCRDAEELFEVAREKVGQIRELIEDIPISSCLQLLVAHQWDVNEACAKALETEHLPRLFSPERSYRVDHSAECMLSSLCDEEGPVATLSCKHSLHRTCLAGWVSSAVQEHAATFAISVRCPDTSCRSMIELDALEWAAGEDEPTSLALIFPAAPPPADRSAVAQVRSRWRSCVQSLLSSSNEIIPCPTAQCPMFLTASALVSEVQCTAGCGSSFCTRCRSRAHGPASCEQAKAVRTADVDGDTSRLLLEDCRNCPRCRALTFRSHGCNHMVCSRCGAEYCWICGKDWSLHSNSFYICTLATSDGADGVVTRFGYARARHLLAISKVAVQESSIRANLALRARLHELGLARVAFVERALLLLERARTRVAGGWILFGEYVDGDDAAPDAMGGSAVPSDPGASASVILTTLLRERINMASNLCDRLNYHLNYLYSVLAGTEPVGDRDITALYGTTVNVPQWERALSTVAAAVERQMDTLGLGLSDLKSKLQ